MRLLSKQPNHEFRALKKIRISDKKETRECNSGDTFTVDSQDANAVAEINSLVHCGFAEPTLIPEKGRFMALCAFTLRDSDGNLTQIKSKETIELSRELILPLILQRRIIPVDVNKCWCPFRLKETIKITMPWEQPVEKKRPWVMGWKDKGKQHPAGLSKSDPKKGEGHIE